MAIPLTILFFQCRIHLSPGADGGWHVASLSGVDAVLDGPVQAEDAPEVHPCHLLLA